MPEIVCLSFIEESVGLPSQEIVCLSFIEESVGLPSPEIVYLSFIEESVGLPKDTQFPGLVGLQTLQ
jgi:hypothetical protein